MKKFFLCAGLALISFVLMLSLPLRAGTKCEGVDGNYIFNCDGQSAKICHSITANGNTYECHGNKRTRPAPFVN